MFVVPEYYFQDYGSWGEGGGVGYLNGLSFFSSWKRYSTDKACDL